MASGSASSWLTDLASISPAGVELPCFFSILSFARFFLALAGGVALGRLRALRIEEPLHGPPQLAGLERHVGRALHAGELHLLHRLAHGRW